MPTDAETEREIERVARLLEFERRLAELLAWAALIRARFEARRGVS